jgi:hypothetical protein
MPVDTPPQLAVEIDLALDWQPMQSVPAAAEGEREPEDVGASHALIVTLRGIDAALAQPGGDQAGALARIDAKLDLILLLLGERAAEAAGPRVASDGTAERRGSPGPVTTRVRLSPESICWLETGAPPAPDSTLWIYLLLEPGAPFKVRLPARVTAVDAQADPTAGAARGSLPIATQVSARFTGLTEPAREALASRVFRLHRKAIQARRI